VPSNSLSARPLSSRDELALALAGIPARFGVTRDFPAEVLEEAETVALHVPLPDRDLTDIPFVTIDPAGAKDLDQAMHLARVGDGYRVLYAIADVPAVVRPDGAIDMEARRRGQTVYTPDGRIPLHPPVLSEGAASLLANAVRGAFVWQLDLDNDGTVVTATVARARVKSVAQLDYQGVQTAIDAGTAGDMLVLLPEIGAKRVALEIARGGASLGTQETDIDAQNGEYVIERRVPFAVETWNAQLSLMTGMAAADIMLRGGIGLLRTMPPADDAAIDRFRRQTIALGRPWPREQRYGDYLRSLDVGAPKQLAIMHAAMALFRGAGYTAFDGTQPEHTIQAAVAAPYAHVTAPLRRLVDRFGLLVCEALCTDTPVPDWVRSTLPTLPQLMATTSSTTGQIDAAVLNTVEAALLHNRVGDEFRATVLSATTDYGTIQLNDPVITARCDGQLEAGADIRVRLVTAEISTGTVRFELA
jgi:exoribonuclease R